MDAIVARIDERTKSIQTELVQIRIDLKENLESVIDKVRGIEHRHDDRMRGIDEKIEKIEEKLDKDFVKHHDISLLQKVVYGMVGLICTIVIGAIVTTVMIHPKETNDKLIVEKLHQ